MPCVTDTGETAADGVRASGQRGNKKNTARVGCSVGEGARKAQQSATMRNLRGSHDNTPRCDVIV